METTPSPSPLYGSMVVLNARNASSNPNNNDSKEKKKAK